MSVRPRLLVVSLVVAVIVSVGFGWILSRTSTSGPSIDATAQLDTPGVYQIPSDEGSPNPGRALPVVDLLDGQDRPVSTESLVGAPAVINVWFAACPPCERELADFAEVHAEFGDQVRFIGINPFDSPERSASFAAERGVTYELWQDIQSEFIDAVELVAFPRTYFVNADGTIIGETGVLDAAQLRFAVRELLR